MIWPDDQVGDSNPSWNIVSARTTPGPRTKVRTRAKVSISADRGPIMGTFLGVMGESQSPKGAKRSPPGVSPDTPRQRGESTIPAERRSSRTKGEAAERWPQCRKQGKFGALQGE